MKVIYGVHLCTLESKPSEAEVEALRHATCYTPNDAVAYANKMRYGKGGKRFGPKLDPRKWLYHKGQRTFPTGLLENCMGAIHNPVLVDAPQLVSAQPWKIAVEGWSPRRGQLGAWKALTDAGRGISVMSTATGKTGLCAMLASSYPNERVLVSTPNKRLLNQNAEEIARFLGEPVGILGDSQRNLKPRVLVATIQSLASRIEAEDPEILELLAETDLWICDESHGAAADSYKALSRALTRCHKRMGLTATWSREDGCQKIMEGVLSDKVVFEYTYEQGVADGVLTPIRIWTKTIMHRKCFRHKKKPPYVKYYTENITDNIVRNMQIVLDTCEFIELGFTPCLVMCTRKEHGKILSKLLGCQFINGEDETKAVDSALDKFLAGEFPVLVASNILNVGVDMPPLRSAVNAACGDSAIDAKQKPGRGVRQSPGKTHFDYRDYIDEEPNFFKNHSAKRVFIYKSTFTNRVKDAMFVSEQL